jgi:hypothetical protein
MIKLSNSAKLLSSPCRISSYKFSTTGFGRTPWLCNSCTGLLIYQHSTVAAMAAAIESQYGKFELTDIVSRQGSFTPIKAGTTFHPSRSSSGSSSGSSSAFTSFTETSDSQMHSGRDWQAAGSAAAAAGAAEDGMKFAAADVRAMGSRPLPVWLATVLQIGGLVLLGQVAYAFICAALEVRGGEACSGCWRPVEQLSHCCACKSSTSSSKC